MNDYYYDFAMGYADASGIAIPEGCDDPYDFLVGYNSGLEKKFDSEERFDKGKSIPCGKGWIPAGKTCHVGRGGGSPTSSEKKFGRGKKIALGAGLGAAALAGGGAALALGLRSKNKNIKALPPSKDMKALPPAKEALPQGKQRHPFVEAIERSNNAAGKKVAQRVKELKDKLRPDEMKTNLQAARRVVEKRLSDAQRNVGNKVKAGSKKSAAQLEEIRQRQMSKLKDRATRGDSKKKVIF